MAVLETPVLLISKAKSGERRLIYPITRADCVDGLEELIYEKIDAESVSWNDLPDKPFGENTDGTVKHLDNKFLSILDGTPASETDILSKQDVQFVGGEGAPNDTAVLVTGETYHVIWDTDEYVFEAKNVVFDGIDGVGIGNTSLIGVGEDTGEEFVLGYAPAYGINVFVTQSTEEITHSVRIYQKTDALYKIKEEYIPESSIPTFNLVEMGLPALKADGSLVYVDTDTSAIRTALDKGPARFLLMESNGVTAEVVGYAIRSGDDYAIDRIMTGSTVRRIYIMGDAIMAQDMKLDASGLPDVTAEDNGKSLQVVDGKWAAGKTTGTSWNDLNDRPFGENTDGTVKQLDNKFLSILGGTPASETEILAETQMAFTGGVGGPDETTVFVAGETYYVVWDGTEYILQAKNVLFNGVDGIVLGNTSLINSGENTGEPFCLGYAPAYAYNEFLTDSAEDSTHTIRIYQSTPETYRVKNDYLDILDGSPASETDVFPERGLPFGINNDYGCFMCSVAPAVFTVTVGEEYIVIWDGEKYTCTAVDFSALSPGAVAFGNMSIIGAGADTGEPFGFAYVPASGEGAVYDSNVCVTASEETSHTVRIYQTTPASYKIKEEYMPFDAIKAYIDECIGEALRGTY